MLYIAYSNIEKHKQREDEQGNDVLRKVRAASQTEMVNAEAAIPLSGQGSAGKAVSRKQNMEVIMNAHGTWSPYAGGSAILLAVVLFLMTGVLVYVATRLRQPRRVKQTGTFLGISFVVVWVLSVIGFLTAATIYGAVLVRQTEGPIVSPKDPITPVTMTSALLTFFVIIYLLQQRGAKVAIGSAIVGTIAAPMLFELPFDLIVMWRTYPPSPAIPFTFLYFLPLILVELLSFAMLTLSPAVKLSRYTLFFLAGMFLIFAIWALFGFAYPYNPLPTALNMISKVLAFAAAVSLFLPLGERSQEKVPQQEALPQEEIVH